MIDWSSDGHRKVEGDRLLFMRSHGLSTPPDRHFYRARIAVPPIISPRDFAVPTGGSISFAVLNGEAAMWSVMESDGGAVSPSGVYTAPASPGAFHVRASAVENPDAFSEALVRVVGVSTAEAKRFIDAANYSDSVKGDGVLVMKEGAIVFERYVGAMTHDTPHMLASGTKSFSAALFALGQLDGIWTLQEKVSTTITEWQDHPSKSEITIEHLLTLTSGLVDSPAYDANPDIVVTLDTYDLAINQSSTPYPPGVACIYAPSNFQVLAAVFERKTGQDPVAYLYNRLLSKLGIVELDLGTWTRDLKGNPQMAGGAYLSARQWANYGQLWLQGGQWNGATILDPNLVKVAVSIENPAFMGYGLTWWLNRPTQGTYNPPIDTIPVDGRGDGDQIASNAPPDMYMAAGTGKQRLYVVPSKQLVIVRFGRGIGGAFSDHEFLGRLLGAP
jgi:CubicO group peptidase (beta-lactamase class C family)